MTEYHDDLSAWGKQVQTMDIEPLYQICLRTLGWKIDAMEHWMNAADRELNDLKQLHKTTLAFKDYISAALEKNDMTALESWRVLAERHVYEMERPVRFMGIGMTEKSVVDIKKMRKEASPCLPTV